MTTSVVLSFLIGSIAAGGLTFFWLRYVAPKEDSELAADLRDAKQRVIELETKGKEMYAANTKLEATSESLRKENTTLEKKIATYESQESTRLKEHQKALHDATAMKNSFEEEKVRIRKEDEERLTQEEEERDRMWAEHEINVLAKLNDLCKQPQFRFTCYDNNNLPKGFHGSLKPDFMIEFLEQYVIFDAKVSKAKSLQTYINDAVKKTAAKVKGKDTIYPSIFLVVPTNAISELKSTSYYEEGFTFFVISPEALGPILASFKKIETYEFAEQWDPQERENIIDLIAHYHAHIASRNSFDYLIVEEGLKTLAKTKSLDPEIAQEALAKAAKIRNLNLNTAEQKQLAAEPALLAEKLSELVSPKAALDKKDIDQLRS